MVHKVNMPTRHRLLVKLPKRHTKPEVGMITRHHETSKIVLQEKACIKLSSSRCYDSVRNKGLNKKSAVKNMIPSIADN